MRFNRCFETYSRGRNVIFRTRQEITPLFNGVKMSSGDRVNYAVNRLFTMLFDALCLLFTVGRGLCPAEFWKRFLCGEIGFLQNYVSYKTQPFITSAKDKPSPYGGEMNFRDRANYTVKTSFCNIIS